MTERDSSSCSEPECSEDSPYRERCYTCYRPVSACFCHAIPEIDNRTQILILQHVKERFHAFNTARIVKAALKRCDLLVDQTTNLATTSLPLYPDAGVLYPGPGAVPLERLPADRAPSQLVILDGTWHHAKTLMREIPALQKLPRYCLTPESPSGYQIRRPPSDTALSTLEAVVAALEALEPETSKIRELLTAFQQMVNDQLRHPKRSARIRNRGPLPRPSVNIPAVLLREPENVVVAYGETFFGGVGQSRSDRVLVYWVAQRLFSDESFEAAIRPSKELDSDFLSHLELEPRQFQQALSAREFRDKWARFVKPHETLCVFNARTAAELNKLNADLLPVVSLKSVNLHRTCRSLDEILEKLHLPAAPVVLKGRAGKRLANARAYARYLSRYEDANAHAETESLSSP